MSDEQVFEGEIDWLTRHSEWTRFGVLAGVIVAVVGSALGFFATLGLYTAVGFGYGLALCRLGRAGCPLLLDQ